MGGALGVAGVSLGLGASVLGVPHPRRRARAAPAAAAALRADLRRTSCSPAASSPSSRWRSPCSQRDFSLAYVAQVGLDQDAAAVQLRRPVELARGLDPAVVADPRRLRGGRRVAVPPPPRGPARRLGAGDAVRHLRVLLPADVRAGQPVQAGGRGASRSTGPGPNPLLQNHVLMAFHPPILYLGYVGFSVPFAFAIAALVTGRVGEGWLLATRRWTLLAWGFLTVGIILGAWWSYEVLGWGGYWAWDPVENASFLPVADRHGLHPLGAGAGAARDAAGLEPGAAVRHVQPHDPRHVPHPLRRARQRPRLQRVDDRAVAPDVLRPRRRPCRSG